jgi:small subunit ribosomal protein S17
MAEAKTTKKTAKKAAPTAGESAEARGMRKSREGIVVSAKMDKTVVVAVVRQVRHTMYGKFIRRTKKYYAHDEGNSCGIGDAVRIVETRPLSKLKRWRVETVVRKAE